MGEPEERRREAELVEPLFAGLRGADSPDGPDPDDSPPPDPWKHHARSQPLPATAPDVEEEPATVRLFVKALFMMLALIAIAAAFYLVFGV